MSLLGRHGPEFTPGTLGSHQRDHAWSFHTYLQHSLETRARGQTVDQRYSIQGLPPSCLASIHEVPTRVPLLCSQCFPTPSQNGLNPSGSHGIFWHTAHRLTKPQERFLQADTWMDPEPVPQTQPFSSPAYVESG